MDDHRAANVGRVDASRSIAFYDERPGHVANVYVARAVVYRHIPADILDPKIAGAIGDVNRSGGAHDGEIARSVAGFEGADVEHFQIAAAVGPCDVAPGRVHRGVARDHRVHEGQAVADGSFASAVPPWFDLTADQHRGSAVLHVDQKLAAATTGYADVLASDQTKILNTVFNTIQHDKQRTLSVDTGVNRQLPGDWLVEVSGQYGRQTDHQAAQNLLRYAPSISPARHRPPPGKLPHSCPRGDKRTYHNLPHPLRKARPPWRALV